MTKTSLEQEWGRPSDKQLGHELYAKPMRISNLFSPKERKGNSANTSVTAVHVRLEDLHHSCPLRVILKEYNVNEEERFVKGILRDCIFNVIEMSDDNHCHGCIMNLLNFYEDHSVYSSHLYDLIADKDLEAFYTREVLLDEAEIIKMCLETRRQSSSDKWFSVRGIRISASSRAHAIKMRQSKTIDSLINGFLTRTSLTGRAKKKLCMAQRMNLQL